MTIIQELAKINTYALKYFCRSLDKSKYAKKYLLNRVDTGSIRAFWLGYAPAQGLIDYFNAHDVSGKLAESIGLIAYNDDGTAYEIMTKRIIFPIFSNGKISGFAGRAIKEHPVKYLNSKSNILYNKRQMLYLLDKSKKHIYKTGWGILVEGYFDVIALAEVGIHNAVASCGTAFTDEQARLLRRWAEEVYVCYDGDSAGHEAARKAKKLLVKHNIYGGTIKLPDRYDPDEFIKKYGKKKFLALKNS